MIRGVTQHAMRTANILLVSKYFRAGARKKAQKKGPTRRLAPCGKVLAECFLETLKNCYRIVVCERIRKRLVTLQ